MAERVDLGVRGTIQDDTNKREWESDYTQISTDTEGRLHIGYLGTALDLRPSVEKYEKYDAGALIKSDCKNPRRLENLEKQFGKLFRVGCLCGYDWTDEIPSQPCRYVEAHIKVTEFSTSTIKVSSDRSKNSLNSIILVDTFEKSVRSRIAAFVQCRVDTDSDPKELVYYIANVAKLGFNHIIIFGETDYGMIFLDCFGRVFIWEDTDLSVYPLGKNLEEAQKYPIENIAWFVANETVYEYIKEPQPIYTDTEEVKKQKSSKK